MTVPAIKDDLTRQLMTRSLGKTGLALPFSKELLLLETHVAGTGHYRASSLKEPLKQGDYLVLKREPKNPHDELAISIETQDGVRLGYVPRDENSVIARLMDAGKQISAEVVTCDYIDAWTEIDISVSMIEL